MCEGRLILLQNQSRDGQTQDGGQLMVIGSNQFTFNNRKTSDRPAKNHNFVSVHTMYVSRYV